jgi:hypothetical protein
MVRAVGSVYPNGVMIPTTEGLGVRLERPGWLEAADRSLQATGPVLAPRQSVPSLCGRVGRGRAVATRYGEYGRDARCCVGRVERHASVVALG